MFVWEPTDFVAGLETVPEVGEWETEYAYTVQKDGMRLELAVDHYAGDIFIALYRDGVQSPVFQMNLIGCSGARYVNEPTYRGEYLEFAPAKCFGNRYDGAAAIPFGLRLSVKPSISIVLF